MNKHEVFKALPLLHPFYFLGDVCNVMQSSINFYHVGDHVISATKRLQLLKLSIEKSPYMGVLLVLRQKCPSAEPRALLALSRQTHSAAGSPGVCPGTRVCSVFHCFLLEATPSCVICARVLWSFTKFQNSHSGLGWVLEGRPSNICQEIS